MYSQRQSLHSCHNLHAGEGVPPFQTQPYSNSRTEKFDNWHQDWNRSINSPQDMGAGFSSDASSSSQPSHSSSQHRDLLSDQDPTTVEIPALIAGIEADEHVVPSDETRKLPKADEEQELAHFNAFIAHYEQRPEKMSNLFDKLMNHGRSLEKQVHELERKLEMQSEENKFLKNDLQSVKQKIATLSTTANDVADDQLKAKMEDIYSMSAAWVRTSFRKHSICMITPMQLSDASWRLLLSRHVNTNYFFELATYGERTKFAQAIVGTKLCGVLEDFYFGIERDGKFGNVAELAKNMYGERGYNEWRSRTIVALEATENSLTRTSMHIKLESMVKSLEECLSVMFGVKASHTRREQLVPIFEEAVKFSRILGAQRASYSILMLNQKMKNDRAFDDEAMEDVDVESGYTPTQIGKQVKFVIFPALIKEVTQDEETRRSVFISKAKVVC